MKSKNISFALLPFKNLTGTEEDYFVRGFIEDIIIDLSRFSDLSILSLNTSMNLDSESADLNEKLEELDIDYYLTGSYRHLESTLRINTRLLQTDQNKVIWAEKYDAQKDEVFNILDDVVKQVVAKLHARIDAIQLAASRSKSVTEMEPMNAGFGVMNF